MHSNKFCVTELNGVSNNDGMIAYFPSEKLACNFANSIAITHRRLEILLDTIEIDKNDETSYNELEKIVSELKHLKTLNI